MRELRRDSGHQTVSTWLREIWKKLRRRKRLPLRVAGRIGKIRDIDLVDAGSGDFIGKSLNDGFAVLSERRASVEERNQSE